LETSIFRASFLSYGFVDGFAFIASDGLVSYAGFDSIFLISTGLVSIFLISDGLASTFFTSTGFVSTF